MRIKILNIFPKILDEECRFLIRIHKCMCCEIGTILRMLLILTRFISISNVGTFEDECFIPRVYVSLHGMTIGEELD